MDLELGGDRDFTNMFKIANVFVGGLSVSLWCGVSMFLVPPVEW